MTSYQPLSEAVDPPSSSNSFEIDREKDDSTIYYVPGRNPLTRRLFKAGFVLSVVLNIALASLVLIKPPGDTNHVHEHMEPEGSRFAGLKRTIPRPWLVYDLHEEAQDAMWNATTYDRGNIALSDEYAEKMGLPRAQRFPWDNSKGVYLINAYHNLHCVKTLRTSIVEYHKGLPQASPYLHVIHCLNVLRDEVMCDADDVPRYTGYQPQKKSGLGQVRMCRDWSQMEAWADQNTACWKHMGDITKPGYSELDRYRFCPPNSPYHEDSQTLWMEHTHEEWEEWASHEVGEHHHGEVAHEVDEQNGAATDGSTVADYKPSED